MSKEWYDSNKLKMTELKNIRFFERDNLQRWFIYWQQKVDYTKKIYLYEAQISYYPQTYLEIVLQLMDWFSPFVAKVELESSFGCTAYQGS